MVGAHILNHMHGISDEAVAERLCGDVYWMAFCGINEPFATEGWKPLDSSTLTYFRKRIGPDGVRKIEEVIREQLIGEKQISGKSQYVNTTAMEKNIAYPTDTDLLDKGRKRLIAGFQKLKDLGRKISIGRTFKDKAKQAILQVVKLGKGRQERIKEAATQLAGFAREILDKVPSALRKAKKHKNKN